MKLDRIINATPAGLTTDLSAGDTSNPVIVAAYQEGQAAYGHPFACPYISGQQVYGAWLNGYTDAGIAARTVPQDAPLYEQGRIACGIGLPLSMKPAGERTEGRWVSGWLRQRETIVAARMAAVRADAPPRTGRKSKTKV